MAGMDPALEDLATAHGVATWYRDARRRRVDVESTVVRRVLGLLGVSADTPARSATHWQRRGSLDCRASWCCARDSAGASPLPAYSPMSTAPTCRSGARYRPILRPAGTR